MRDDELRLALEEMANAEADDDALRHADAPDRQRLRSRDRLARIRSHVDDIRILNRRRRPS